MSVNTLLGLKEFNVHLQSLASSGQNRSHVPRLPKFTQVMKAVFIASVRRSFSYKYNRKHSNTKI